MNIRLVKLGIGLLLVLLMVGHNFVFNAPQSLQDSIMSVHQVPITQFNLLYTLQTLPTIFLIIPLGFLYDSYGAGMLIPSALLAVIGQVLMIIYTPLRSSFSFIMMITGRVLQGISAEILYMGQGVLATKWMGSLVGFILVLPEIGEIGNAFITPILNIHGGLYLALVVGLILCVVSVIASILLYFFDKKHERSFLAESLPTGEVASEEVNCSRVREYSSLFWVLILICAIDESIYIPFMDNANTMIQLRFGVEYSKTGVYLCIPFAAASTSEFSIVLSTIIFGLLLKRFTRRKLTLISGIIGLAAHTIIYMLPNTKEPTALSLVMVALSFFLFGFGLGSYYSIIYPMVGLSVKKEHTGTAYAIVSFVQALGMTIYPQISAFIIERGVTQDVGYTNSSLLYILTAVAGMAGCLYLLKRSEKILTTSDAEQYPSQPDTTDHNLQDYENLALQNGGSSRPRLEQVLPTVSTLSKETL